MIARRIVGWGRAPAGLLVCLLPLSCRGGAPERPSDYDADLRRLERLIAAARGAPSLPGEAAGDLALLLGERSALTGDPLHARAAAAALDEALARSGPAPRLVLARAELDLRYHRLPEARRALDRLSALAARPAVRALRADVALQEGRYAEAGRAYRENLDRRRTWDALARLAHLEALRGDAAAADRLYAEAADELTAKQMRALAWLELQRGRLHVERGRPGEARARYERAGRAYSGYWLVDEHRAELLRAEGRFAEAAALYRELVARTPKPEWQQALGDVHVSLGEPARAAPWHERALAGYLDSARRGEVHYLHHLAAFYADVRGDGEEALEWARRDLELRPGVPALEGVAWALYRAGRVGEARRAIRRALAPGLQDAHLLSRAGLIHLADGRGEEGERLLARAAALNPRYSGGHAHP